MLLVNAYTDKADAYSIATTSEKVEGYVNQYDVANTWRSCRLPSPSWVPRLRTGSTPTSTSSTARPTWTLSASAWIGPS